MDELKWMNVVGTAAHGAVATGLYTSPKSDSPEPRSEAAPRTSGLSAGRPLPLLWVTPLQGGSSNLLQETCSSQSQVVSLQGPNLFLFCVPLLTQHIKDLKMSLSISLSSRQVGLAC